MSIATPPVRVEHDLSIGAASSPRPVVTMTPVEESEPPRKRPGIARIAASWVCIAVASIILVLVGLSPLFHQRDQSQLFADYQVTLQNASKQAQTVAGLKTPTTASEPGTAVAILEMGGVHLQEVVVEGVAPSITRQGPGHVPGTAGLGQPGNSVIVGRRALYGGPFHAVGDLHEGDTVFVATAQGQSVYKISAVRDHTIDDTPATVADAAVDPYANDSRPKEPMADEVVTSEALFGPTADDRLTIVTSAEGNPLSGGRATVAVAKLQGKPFPPTPQGGRIASDNGWTGDATAWAPLVLALMAYAAAAVSAVILFRRSSLRVAYLLAVPPLIAFTVVLAETASRLLPGWA